LLKKGELLQQENACKIRFFVAASPALVEVALFRASADCKTRVFNTHEGDYTL